MIRIIYSDNVENMYSDISIAKFWIVNRLFESKGKVVPISAAEIFGRTTGGITVERKLTIKLGLVQFE